MRSFRQLLLVSLLVLFGKSLSAQTSVLADVATTSILIPKIETTFEVPIEISDLMTSARARFLEGYMLIQTGDTDDARVAFDAALDMLDTTRLDFSQITTLNTFYWELVRQIKDAESAYLYLPEEMQDEEDVYENAVRIMSDEEIQDLGLKIRDDVVLKQALSDAYQTQFDIPIGINNSVAKSLDYLLNRGRKYFSDGLVRSGQYRPLIEQIFREEDVPLDLISLAQVESAFKPQALSRAKAKGLWQFVRGTAIRYGLKVTTDIDERSDPEKSTRAAARYLKDLYATFNDWDLVLAAYNWGEGNIQRLLKNTGLENFWQLADLNVKRKRLPAETRQHVPMIHASAILARNPEKYGFPTELEPQLSYATVTVSKPIDLRAIAKILSTSFDELKKLNPAISGSRTPANYPNFALKVPTDSDPDLYELIDKLPAARAVAVDGKHKVESGDTLSDIARKYGVSLNALKQANDLSDKSILKVGKVLDIPVATSKPKTTAAKPAIAQK